MAKPGFQTLSPETGSQSGRTPGMSEETPWGEHYLEEVA